MQMGTKIPAEPGRYWLHGWPLQLAETSPVEVFVRPGHDYLCISNPSCCQHTISDVIPVCKIVDCWSDRIEKPANEN